MWRGRCRSTLPCLALDEIYKGAEKLVGDTARQLEAYDSEKVFKIAFGVVVKHTDAAKPNEPLTRKSTQTIVQISEKGSRKNYHEVE